MLIVSVSCNRKAPSLARAPAFLSWIQFHLSPLIQKQMNTSVNVTFLSFSCLNVISRLCSVLNCSFSSPNVIHSNSRNFLTPLRPLSLFNSAVLDAHFSVSSPNAIHRKNYKQLRLNCSISSLIVIQRNENKTSTSFSSFSLRLQRYMHVKCLRKRNFSSTFAISQLRL